MKQKQLKQVFKIETSLQIHYTEKEDSASPSYQAQSCSTIGGPALEVSHFPTQLLWRPEQTPIH